MPPPSRSTNLPISTMPAEGDVLLDGGNQFRDTAKHAIAQAFGGDVTEEALDHVEPGRRGGGEMHMEPRVLGQPLLDLRMLVRGVVIADQMKGLVVRCFTVDLAQEIKPLGMTMARLAARDDGAVEGI